MTDSGLTYSQELILQTQVPLIQRILMESHGSPLTQQLEPLAPLHRVSLLVSQPNSMIIISRLIQKGVTDIGQSVFKSEDAGVTCKCSTFPTNFATRSTIYRGMGFWRASVRLPPTQRCTPTSAKMSLHFLQQWCRTIRWHERNSAQVQYHIWCVVRYQSDTHVHNILWIWWSLGRYSDTWYFDGYSFEFLVA